MAISNGFDTTQVMTALKGRLGWAGDTPTSGRFFDIGHPLVTKAVIKSAQGTAAISDADFVTFLDNLQQAVIMQMLNGVFNEPQLIESTLIFDRQLRQDLVYPNMGKFVGLRLLVAPGEFAAKISRASFIFNGVATFNLYLFQDMKTAPLFTKSITTVANEETLVDLTDWIAHYNQPQSQGGVFYLGYFQNDLPNGVNALDQFISRWNETYVFGYTTFEAIQPDPAIKDFIRIQVPYSFRSYGMNFKIETYRDFTERIIKNASLFDEAIWLSMAAMVLLYASYSTRVNGIERITQPMADRIYAEINNSGAAIDGNPYIAGLAKQIQRELKRINDNFFAKEGVISTRPPIFGDKGLQGV